MPQRKRTAATAFLANNHDHAPAPSIDESATLRADSTAELPKRLRVAEEEEEEEEEEELESMREEELIPVEELRGMGHEELVQYAFAVGRLVPRGADLRAVKGAVEAEGVEGARVGLVGDPVVAAAVAGELDEVESESGSGEDDDEDEEDEDDEEEGNEGGDGVEDGNEDEDEDEESVDARWTRRKITGWVNTYISAPKAYCLAKGTKAISLQEASTAGC
ncbi:hypothetical protein NpNSSI1_00012767 [Neofusicoccum parvum]|nr:hypothetical protein NpNSSI1_00012767 [Neofusicoccum parvum]